MKPLSQQLSAWALKSEDRIEAVIKSAVQDMTNDMQRPRAKGGRMPVDTGALRNSGTYSQPLLQWDVFNSPITYGWTANYAPYMDARYGFLRLPVQEWPEYVRKAAFRVRRQFNEASR